MRTATVWMWLSSEVANKLEAARELFYILQILSSSQRKTTAIELSTVQPSGWLVGVLLWKWFATSVWGVSFGIPQMFLAQCQHKYGERVGEKEGAMQAMQITLPQQSTESSEDRGELYCRRDMNRSTWCHLLMASGTTAIHSSAAAEGLQGLDRVKITVEPNKKQ